MRNYSIKTIETMGLKSESGKMLYGTAALLRYVKLSKADYIGKSAQPMQKTNSNTVIDIKPAHKKSSHKRGA